MAAGMSTRLDEQEEVEAEAHPGLFLDEGVERGGPGLVEHRRPPELGAEDEVAPDAEHS